MSTEERRGKLRWRLIGILGKSFVDLLFRTTRVESVGLSEVAPLLASRRLICAFWHSRILLISYLFQGSGAAILVSRSEDGEIIARILERQGHRTVRGSTSKGGLRALSSLIRCIGKENLPGAIVPDGPRGPRFRVQPGVITLAKKTGRPILPISYSAKRMKVFSSWDRFILPLPFTRCRLVYGRPLEVPWDASPEEEEICRRRLEAELRRITRESDRFFGHDLLGQA
jgi:lysophospholipid acyltransferase (LPLAT)-like uncharacterized protein